MFRPDNFLIRSGVSPGLNESVSTGLIAVVQILARRTFRPGLDGNADTRCRDDAAKQITKMAGVAGLEPVTSAVTGQRSNQLSYTPAQGEAKSTENRRPRQDEEKNSGSRRQGGGGGEPR